MSNSEKPYIDVDSWGVRIYATKKVGSMYPWVDIDIDDIEYVINYLKRYLENF